MLLYFL